MKYKNLHVGSVLLLLMSVIPSVLFAKISGLVSNESDEPVLGASCLLLSLPDTIYVDGTVSDNTGRFAFEDIKLDRPYLLTIQAYGYNPVTLNLSQQTTFPLDVKLSLVDNELAEVVVTSKHPIISQEAGKFIFVPNDLADEVSSARGLMNYVPLVSWGDRKASIIGRGEAKVYLNGKDPHWDTVEVSAMLRTLNPYYIKRVEVITDPGASMSASFAGGIINIVYDDPTQGFRTNIYTTAHLINDNPTVWPNLWLNYQMGKFKSSLNLQYYYRHQQEDNEEIYDYKQLDKIINNHTTVKSFTNAYRAKLNLSYDVTKNSLIGVSAEVVSSRDHTSTEVSTSTSKGGETEVSFMKQIQNSPSDHPGIRGILYYTLDTSATGSKLDAAITYSYQDSENIIDNLFSSNSYIQRLKDRTHVESGKVDYTHVFKAGMILQGGLEYVNRNTNDTEHIDAEYYRFDYIERLMQGYLQYNWLINNKFSISAGLRLENSYTKGTLQNIQSDKQNYTDLFPSASFNWNLLKNNQSLSISFVKKIDRPMLKMLNPYKIWSSDNTYSQGNPYLRPTYINTVSLNYSLANQLIASVIYNYTSQLVSQYTINNAEGQSATSYTNSGRSNNVLFIVNYSKPFFNIWRFSVNVMAVYSNLKTRAEQQLIRNSNWCFMVRQNNSFTISRRYNVSAYVGQSLSSARNHALYKEDWRYNVDAGVSKSFDFGLDLSLSGILPLIGYKTTRTLDLADYGYKFLTHNNQYSLQLTVSYTIGKSLVYGARDRSYEIKE
ncbi:MAG: TonB-dependent receptor family protein [Muribaculaceae bacterium]|nr:TonB-dependent receptor family protein [Muribaculaceae bacterium]